MQKEMQKKLLATNATVDFVTEICGLLKYEVELLSEGKELDMEDE